MGSMQSNVADVFSGRRKRRRSTDSSAGADEQAHQDATVPKKLVVSIDIPFHPSK